MLDAARAARSFVQGRTRADLDSDQMFSYAVVRALEIVGEAARNVPPDGRSQHPNIAWPQMAGMRNRLIHAYFDVDLNLDWEVVTEELPPPIAELERIVPPWPDEAPAPNDQS